ncbi:MAG: polyprenyl synthetase family protein [Saprospiraceae bacterium]|nr:polyprenyl synthetase family protein [Saprospiraceae bacterium]
MHRDRKDLMENVRKQFDTELKGVLVNLKLQKEWEEIVFGLHRKRAHNISVRGPFAAAVYEYVCEQARLEGKSLTLPDTPTLFYVHLPFIAETVIIIQYLENHILDGKDGVKPENGLQWEVIKNKLLASHYLKDFLYDYVRSRVFPTHCPERELLENCLRRMFQITEEGQYAEKTWSKLAYLEHGLPKGMPAWSAETKAYMDDSLMEAVWKHFQEHENMKRRESFVRFYLQRVYCTNAAFFGLLAECIMDLTGYRGPEREQIKCFATGFGMTGQMVNDIADYLPAHMERTGFGKIPEDAYSDLRNNNFTLPFLFAITDFDEAARLLTGNLYSDVVQDVWFVRVKPNVKKMAIPALRAYSKEIKLHIKGSSTAATQLKDFADVVYNGRYFGPF